MRFASALLASSVALSASGVSHAGVLSAKYASPCFYPASASNDGCAASPGGSVMLFNLLKGYGQNNGQSYHGAPPVYNFPGVHYAVGVPASMVSSLVDVNLAPISTTSTTPGFGILPKGCVKTSSTVINCNLPSGGTISGVNTAPNASHGSVSIIFNGIPGGNILIEYNNLEGDAGNMMSSSAKGVLYVQPGTANVTLFANTIDGHADTLTGAQGQPVTFSTYGTVTATYNAILHAGGRLMNGVMNSATNCAAPGNEDYENNLFVGIGYTTGAGHGEAFEGVMYNPTACNVVTQSITYKNNTCWQPAAVAQGQTTACIYVSSGNPNLSSGYQASYTTSVIDHNLFITNKNNGVTTTSAAVEFAYEQYTNATITNNFIDGSGSVYAFLCTGAPYLGNAYNSAANGFANAPTLSGNVDLVSGDTVNINTIGPSSANKFDQFSTFNCIVP